MSPDDLSRIKAAHAKALCLDQRERESFLNREFGTAPGLREEVCRLLALHDAAGDFLNTPLGLRLFAPATTDLNAVRIGPYQLIRELGQGGSAAVYLARRADDLFERQVAVKILYRLAHSDEVFRRFQREIQILARIEHPYIVRLLDAGTTGEALAYIVTEFVDGAPIDEFAAALTLEQKLELFQKVCEGISSAHRSLIVHRDIKPSNVLVQKDGIPKLLDFGIALLLDGKDVRLTQTGLERMTLQCASPEQIRGEKDISTLSDVYSLGVLLYQLITGRQPFPFPIHDLAQKILTEDPAPMGNVPRDLAAIVNKALSKEPAQRYLSVERLQDDIESFVHGQPVLARGDSAYYRLRKFLKKHWLSVTAAISVAAALLALSVVSIRARHQTQEESARVRDLLAKAFSTAEFDSGTWWLSLRSQRTLETARLAYLEPMSERDRTDLQLQAQRFGSWRSIACVEGLPSTLNLGETREAKRSFQKAVDVGETLLLNGKVEPSHRRDLALAHIEFGSLLLEMNLQSEAESHFQRADALAHLEGADPESRVAFEALAQRSRILSFRGRREEALAMRLQIVEGRRKLFQQDPTGMSWEYAGALCSYGELLREMGRLEAAEAAYSQALPIIEQHARNEPLRLDNRWNLARQNEEYARVLLALRRVPRAVAYLDRAIALYREISRREPVAMSNQRELAGCLGLRAGATAKPDVALFQEALRLSQEAAQHDPGSFRAQTELTTIRAAASALGIKGGDDQRNRAVNP